MPSCSRAKQFRVIPAAKTQIKSQANEEILSALGRRGPDAIDVLLESLEAEEGVHSHIIEKIRKEYDLATAPRTPLRNIHHSSEPQEPTTPPIEGVDRPSKMVYKMTTKPRGIGLIINNKHFTCGMKDRVGTDRDAESLTNLCKFLGFDTTRYNDLTGKSMKAKLQAVGSMDHNNYDCVFVAVLSHGINGKLYSTDGDLIPVEKVTEYFDGNNCPTLIGKPKVFIIQACRGGKFDYGVDSETTDGPSDSPTDSPTGDTEASEEKEVEKVLDGDEADGGGYQGAIPAEADFILAYATVPGYVSWRNSEYGAWFVKAFVDTMMEHSKKEHFLDILTEVNRRVSEEFQSRGRNKQIPSPVSMLTRRLYFRPGAYS